MCLCERDRSGKLMTVCDKCQLEVMADKLFDTLTEDLCDEWVRGTTQPCPVVYVDFVNKKVVA